MTDKLSSHTYIFLKQKNMLLAKNVADINLKKKFKEILKLGSILDVVFHEINHSIYSLLFFMLGGYLLSFQTPRKRKLYEIREGGKYLELILFGKIIQNINLKESLYLLNKKNYSKGVKEFKKGFLELNEKDLIIEGTFSRFNEILKTDDLTKNNNSMTVKNSNIKLLESYIEINNDNCTCIHRNIDINALKKFRFKNN